MTFNCSVCWEPLATAVEPNGGGPVSTDIIATRCGHLYHTICLQDWLRTQDNAGCPTCRTNVTLRDCLKLYPSRDDSETEGRVSKMKEMKQKIEKLQVDLKMANTNAEKEMMVQKSLKVELNSKMIELDRVKELLIEQRQQWRFKESNHRYEVVKLKEEKKSLEKLVADSNVKEARSKSYWKEVVDQREEQCARLGKQLAGSEAKLMLKQEELELAKCFSNIMLHEGEAIGTPRRSPRRRKDLPETEKKSDMLKDVGGRGDVEDEERNSSSGEEMEKQRKIDDEIKRKWREKSIILEPVARDRSRATEDGKKKFKLEVLLAAVGILFIASFYKFWIVDETWMSRSLPNDRFVLISWEDAQKKLRSSVKDMKKRYPSQSMHTWIQILSAVSSTLEKETPPQPSCLVLLTPPNLDSGFTPCLAREVGKVTHSLFRSVNGPQYTPRILQVGPGFLQVGKKTVTEIHDELKTNLNNGKVVIFSDLQQVNDPDRLMMFHAFCHNSAAPDKRATFVFIVPVPRRIYEKYDWASSSSAAEITQEILDESWSSLTPDKRPTLIARVAGYSAMVNPGDWCVE